MVDVAASCRCGGRGRCCLARAGQRSLRGAPENADVELVSLEDADAEAEGKKGDAAAEGEDDIEIEETEEAPFIEETEEGDDDVTDIIGEGREDEEET